MKVRVIGPRDFRPEHVIDTTSHSKTWSRGLSPFYLGPIPLYPGAPVPESLTMENAWQMAKCYSQHIGPDGNPSPEYFEWAAKGWLNPRAERYPMGKGAVPEYTWWAGQKLSYLEARKQVYVPLYIGAVLKTPAWRRLLTIYRASTEELILWDFDGYDRHKLGHTFKECVEDPTRKLGHGVVLAALLETLGGTD